MTATIRVVPVTPDLHPLLSHRERRLSLRRPTHAVVGTRQGGDRIVLGVGRDLPALVGVAAELALTCAARYDVPLWLAPGQTGACAVCDAAAVVVTAEVFGRAVPYWVHVDPAGHSEPSAHAARVGVA